MSFRLPLNVWVSLKVVTSASRVQYEHAKHCVPGGGPPSGVTSATPVFDTAMSAAQPSSFSVPSAISRATSSLVSPNRSIVSFRIPRNRVLPVGEYTIKPMSRHEPLPGTSASKDAIKPAVHDSAVASFLPRELRKETTRRGM